MKRVIKVGGSLLDFPDLSEMFDRWLRPQPPATNIIIGGGGGLVDVIRAWNAQSQINEVTAHWMCVDAMSITARLLAERLHYFDIVDSMATIKTTTTSAIFDAAHWIRESDLPARWSLTSDSIAAALAVEIGAAELVLMKSTSPPSSPMIAAELSSTGLVDAEFPIYSRGIPTFRIVNLRNLD